MRSVTHESGVQTRPDLLILVTIFLMQKVGLPFSFLITLSLQALLLHHHLLLPLLPFLLLLSDGTQLIPSDKASMSTAPGLFPPPFSIESLKRFY